MHRRALLLGAGAAAAGSLAGCSQSGSNGSSSDGPDSNATNGSDGGAPDDGSADDDATEDTTPNDDMGGDEVGDPVRDWLVGNAGSSDPGTRSGGVSFSAERQRELGVDTIPVAEFVPDGTGIEPTGIDRIVGATSLDSPRGPLDYTVVLGTFERDTVVSSMLDAGGNQLETVGPYQLLADGETSIAVADGVLIEMNFPYGENEGFGEDVALITSTAAGEAGDFLHSDPIAYEVATRLDVGLFWRLERLDPSYDPPGMPFDGLDAFGISGSGTAEDWTTTYVYHFPSEADLEDAAIAEHADTLEDDDAVDAVEHEVEGTQVVYEASGEVDPNAVLGQGAGGG